MLTEKSLTDRQRRAGVILIGAMVILATNGCTANRSAIQAPFEEKHADYSHTENQHSDWCREIRNHQVPADAIEQRPLKRVPPRYPAYAAINGLSGCVRMEATITETGHIVDIEIVESEPPGVFDEEAIRAFIQWRFPPWTPEGANAPIRRPATQVFEFHLDAD